MFHKKRTDSAEKKPPKREKIEFGVLAGNVHKVLFSILDILFLCSGMCFISVGFGMIYRPAGYIMTGLCCVALAFFVAKKQAQGR